MEYLHDAIVLLPSYQPEGKLISLVRELRDRDWDVLVVDDGSGAAYVGIFQAVSSLGARVLTHEVNHGKGRALKTGLEYIAQEYPLAVGVVTADGDGQHAVDDIERVMDALKGNPHTFIIGGRAFDGDVPLRSRLGNSFTRGVFRIATGLKINDTQTGLRALPMPHLAKLIDLQGERYEYEMNVLLALKTWDVSYLEIPIRTIYFDDNSRSHFRTVRDALRVFGQILRFAASSLVCFLIDYTFYFLLGSIWMLPIPVAYVSARAVSSVVNFMLNRNIVFRQSGQKGMFCSTLKYFALVVVIAALGSLGTWLITVWGVPRMLSKILIDIVLFFFSYSVQREFVFKKK